MYLHLQYQWRDSQKDFQSHNGLQSQCHSSCMWMIWYYHIYDVILKIMHIQKKIIKF